MANTRPYRAMYRWALALATLALSARPVSAQTDPDSIAAWTARLRTGSLVQRVEAAGKIAAQEPSSLSAPTRDALVSELKRVNRMLLASGTVPGAVELGDETFAEYYLDLVIPVAHFRTPDAVQALVHSVGVGGGIQRRVARHGDAVVPQLAEMIDRSYQEGDALETLALAWFWADSTGASLSASSRATITRALSAAPRSSSYSLRRAAASGLALTGDPAFLSLARLFAQDAAAAGDRLIAAALQRDAIPPLARAAAETSPTELAARVRRNLSAICHRVVRGPRSVACQSLQDHFSAAQQHLRAGQIEAARSAFDAVVRHADKARASGALSAEEHALIAGGAELVLRRM